MYALRWLCFDKVSQKTKQNRFHLTYSQNSQWLIRVWTNTPANPVTSQSRSWHCIWHFSRPLDEANNKTKIRKRATHALWARGKVWDHFRQLRLFLSAFHSLQSHSQVVITATNCFVKPNLLVLVTCLFCDFLPVQPEDDGDVEGGCYHHANEKSQPKTCRNKQIKNNPKRFFNEILYGSWK